MSQGGLLNAKLTDPTITTKFSTDVGDAIPASNTIKIIGGEAVDTSGATDTVTIACEKATDTNLGVAAFDSESFTVTDGLVELKHGALGLIWEVVTTDTKDMESGHGYINKNATPANQTVYTLPTTADVSHMTAISGYTEGGWKIEQNGSQQIFLPDKSTTLGVTGSITSLGGKDWITLFCVTEDDEFVTVSTTDDFGVV